MRRPGPWAAAVLLLWLAALLLLLPPGVPLPLRDWDEGIVARVALERAQSLAQGQGLVSLLLPTYWGQAYLNKPPGLHLLIAPLLLPWLGADTPPPPGVVRLVPALAASAVVPLAAFIHRELDPADRRGALAAAVVALTLLPLMRHGRLAMLDGALVSAQGLLWWQLLRARRQRRGAALLAGLAGSGLLLLKGPVLLPTLTVGLALLALERPAGLRWRPLLLGLLLGLLPGLAWHGLHLWSRGGAALVQWGGDGATRVLLGRGEGSDLGWRLPVLKVLEGGWPWLPLWPFAMARAWQQRRQPRGLWPLGLQLAMAVSVLPLRTQLPWYSHPLWLPFALLTGPLLAALVTDPRLPGVPGAPVLRRLPWFWALLGGLLLAVALVVPDARPLLPPAGLGLLLGSLALGGATGARRRTGALLLVAGWWGSLLLLLQSPHWHWELNEQAPVGPAVALARRATADEPLALWQQAERPSLSWGAGRRLLPLARTPTPSGATLQLLSQGAGPVPVPAGHRCRLAASEQDGWRLWRCPATP